MKSILITTSQPPEFRLEFDKRGHIRNSRIAAALMGYACSILVIFFAAAYFMSTPPSDTEIVRGALIALAPTIVIYHLWMNAVLKTAEILDQDKILLQITETEIRIHEKVISRALWQPRQPVVNRYLSFSPAQLAQISFRNHNAGNARQIFINFKRTDGSSFNVQIFKWKLWDALESTFRDSPAYQGKIKKRGWFS